MENIITLFLFKKNRKTSTKIKTNNMNNLNQTMIRPVNHDEFNQWVREFNISSQWKAKSIKDRVVMDESIQFKDNYIRTYGINKPVKQNIFINAIHKAIKFIKIIDFS